MGSTRTIRPWRRGAAWLAVVVLAVGAHPALAERSRPPRPPPPHQPAPAGTCGLLAGEVFDGRYVCGQGETAVRLAVLTVHGTAVRAEFAFHWDAGGIAGRFTMTGTCDGATGHWVMTPEAWEVRPAGWIMVGMDGTLRDGNTYDGRMMHPSCGGFTVTRTQR